MSASLDATGVRLMDRWQRDFPLTPRAYAAAGAPLGLGEREAIAELAAQKTAGALERVGAVIRPNTAGASTLAAMAVPPARLEEIAAIVSAEPAVNHNYAREHEINLWFVVAASDRAALEATLRRIEKNTGIAVLDLPLERAYHIDLGFPLSGEGQAKDPCGAEGRVPAPDDDERRLLGALEKGLALVARPYAQLGQKLGWSEARVISILRGLIDKGIVSRFGCVVRHRALGFRANAMVVWDVPDDAVDAAAAEIAAHPRVTLCYRRPRRLPLWPYNLFAMIHGRAREEVEALVTEATVAAGLTQAPRAVLFSTRCFKQRGARYRKGRQEAA